MRFIKLSSPKFMDPSFFPLIFNKYARGVCIGFWVAAGMRQMVFVIAA